MYDDTGSAFPHFGKERSTEPNGSEEIDVKLALRACSSVNASAMPIDMWPALFTNTSGMPARLMRSIAEFTDSGIVTSSSMTSNGSFSWHGVPPEQR